MAGNLQSAPTESKSVSGTTQLVVLQLLGSCRHALECKAGNPKGPLTTLAAALARAVAASGLRSQFAQERHTQAGAGIGLLQQLYPVLAGTDICFNLGLVGRVSVRSLRLCAVSPSLESGSE